LAFCACSSSANVPVESSLYGSCTDVSPSMACTLPDAGAYEATIVPILARSCMKSCHDGSLKDVWPLATYDDVYEWSDIVARDLVQCTMPPAASASSYPITREDRETILNWILCGTPR
jgi:hypothetical protein